MAGIGSYEKGKAFTLKSGNKPSFKRMGSSPLKTAGHTAPDPNDGHQHLTNEQALAAANRRKEEGIRKRMSKYNIDKKKATEIWTKQNPPAPQPKSPAKTHEPGHGTSSADSMQGGSEIAPTAPTSSGRKGSTPAKMHKPGHTGPAPKTISRKEELLNQGFTQKDADLMIKSGAVTGKVGGKVTGKAAKPAYIKTIQNKKKKGGKLTKAEKRQLDEYRIHVTEQK